LKKVIQAFGIILLFIISAISPIVISNTIKIFNEIVSESTGDGGLMNSSWPMFQHDVRHTGRSPYGKSGNWFVEKWKTDFGSLTHSSPAIDKNGTIYIGSNNWYFFAFNSDGTLKWKYNTGGGVSSSPAIAEDGIIYVGSDDWRLYAFYPNGTKKWSTVIGDGGVYSSIVIDDNGIIYATSSFGKNICALYPNGSKKWDYKTGNNIYSSPVLDKMGTVYCGSHDGYMYAIYTSNGTLKWRYSTGTKCGGDGATIGDDGTIYFGDFNGYLHAVNPNGTKRWRRDIGANIVSSPSITIGGNIIIGCYDDYVYSFNPYNGTQNWKIKVGNWVSSSPVIDKYGVIYVGTVSGWFYAINPNGTLKWRYKTLDELFSSVAIDENGTIYIAAHCTSQPDFYCSLYALEPIYNNAPDKPIVDGPSSGLINIEYNYTAITSDIDNDNISYYFNWGDGTNSGWTNFMPSGTMANLSHSWEKSGTYTIKVKAKDDYGMESEWGELRVTMPRDKVMSSSLLQRLFDLFPLLEVILSKIINL
jgi:outer membrane protein assembly factor BamB